MSAHLEQITSILLTLWSRVRPNLIPSHFATVRKILPTFFLLFFFMGQALGSEQCLELFRSSVEAPTNINAQQSPSDYQQVTGRNFKHYMDLLRKRFTTKAKNLQPGDIYIDEGGAMGTAAIQIAAKTGARTVIISPQDYSQIITIPELARQWSQHGKELILENKGSRTILKGIKLSNGTIIDIDLVKMSYGLVDSTPPIYIYFHKSGIDLVKYPPESVLLTVEKILAEAALLFAKNNITYEVGLSEKVLSKYENAVTLISDVFAAFFYSPNRLDVLMSAYRALKPGGEAHFLTRARGFWSWNAYKGDEVHLKNGKVVSLPKYLVLKFPTVFTYDNGFDSGVLIMKKGAIDIDLQNFLEVVSYEWYKNDASGYAVPKLIIREK